MFYHVAKRDGIQVKDLTEMKKRIVGNFDALLNLHLRLESKSKQHTTDLQMFKTALNFGQLYPI